MTNLRRYFTYDEHRELYLVTPDPEFIEGITKSPGNIIFHNFMDALKFCKKKMPYFFNISYDDHCHYSNVHLNNMMEHNHAKLYHTIKHIHPRIYFPYCLSVDKYRTICYPPTYLGYDSEGGYFIERLTKIHHHH